MPQVPASTLCSLSAASKLDHPSALSGEFPSSGAGNASRDARAFINRWGLIWKVPISHFEFEHEKKIIHVPYISPLKFIPYLLEKAPELLFGGLDTIQGQKLVSSFWEAYRPIHNSHNVYKDHEGALSTVLPLCLHGDEGRGVRKGNTCIVTLESVFGLKTAEHLSASEHFGACQCCTNGGLNMGKDPLTRSTSKAPLTAYQALNLRGHCFLNKLLVFLLPNDWYKDTDLLDRMIERVCLEVRQLYYEGVHACGRYWHCAILGFKGDLQWYAKVSKLTRCFNRLSDMGPKAMCHECLAGEEGKEFEDANESPCWKDSTYCQRPWNDAPSLTRIPFDTAAPEKVLRRDVFHNTKLGIYRDFTASAVLLLCEMRCFHDPAGRNSRGHLLQRAHGHFRLYCLSVHRPAALHSFTKDNFNAKKRAAYPFMSVKGSDTTLLMEWLCVATRAFINSATNPEHVALLEKLNATARAGNDFMKALYKHGMFLPKACGWAIYNECRKFIRLYNDLAFTSLHDLHFYGFGMKPKFHMVCHTALEMKTLLENPEMSLLLSPLVFSCEANEDAIGRLSRISRRVHQATVCHSTLEKYLVKSKALYNRYKQNRRLETSRKRKCS